MQNRVKLMLERIRKSVQERKSGIMGQEETVQSAVLLPIVERNGELAILFEERAHHLRRQPGEICFPGGRIDPADDSPQSAAIRETCEELGLESSEIELVGPLDLIVTSFQMIHPFVGVIRNPDSVHFNPDEVASVFEVPLAYLQATGPEMHFVDVRMMPSDNFPYEWIPGGVHYKWRVGRIPEYFYFYEERIIWGLTARILHHFLDLL